MAKKKTKAEKEEDAKLLNELCTKMMMSSLTVNANAIDHLHNTSDFGENDFGEAIGIDIKTASEKMKKVADKVKNGDLSDLEEMLTCQVFSLQTLFTTMACKVNHTTNPDHIDLFARFALKSQNQCRSTIATLAEMKNPKRATFIKQLNQANQMQVNNGNDSESENLKKNIKPANELLEQKPNEWLDTGATHETSANDQTMAAMETFNRP